MARIKETLEQRRRLNLFRSLNPARERKNGKIYFGQSEYVDLSSNDYLGLSNHPRIKKAASLALEKWGTGSSASRLLSGDLEIHHNLEEKIASFKGKEAALLFNSGYQANVGIISAICKKGDVIFSDRSNHASIIDGILLSGAKFFRFRHNDTDHLETLLKKERENYKTALVVTESVFSMDGDRSPLKNIATIKEKYDTLFMVDEAHATGIFGHGGSGLAEAEGVTGNIDLIMGTFSKALGSFGAYVACSKELKDYLVNSSRGFIYSTALPPPVIAANLESLNIIKEEPQRRKILLERSLYFRKELEKRALNVKGSSQIVPLILGETDVAIRLSQSLKSDGYWALPIRPPTVPKKEARIRFSLTYYHTEDILEQLISKISKNYKVQIHK